jgi:hypothetical protein
VWLDALGPTLASDVAVLDMSLHQDHVDSMVQYALAVAAEADDLRGQELGPIHLLKYLYLGDLAFARGERGASFSGARWQFYKFGPWSAEIHDRIHVAAGIAGAQKRHFTSRYREDNLRWLLSDVDATYLAERLPRPVATAIRSSVTRFGNDTVSLLHFVYKTDPMLAAAPGEMLNLAPEPEFHVPAGGVNSEQGEASTAKPLPAISKTRIRKLKERLATISEQRRAKHQAEYVVPEPPPVYDDVYAQGVEWLDQLAGAPIPSTRGRLAFDDSVWKAPGRRDSELP